MRYTRIWLGAVVGALVLVVSISAARPPAPSEAKKGHEPRWERDLEKAKQIAARDGRAILASFEGTDWCPWCMKLRREVWLDNTFKEYAKGQLVLLLIDFPRAFELPEAEKKQNHALASRFAIEGLPTVVLLDAEGKRLAHRLPAGGRGEVRRAPRSADCQGPESHEKG
jgi:thioredoxin-related protein